MKRILLFFAVTTMLIITSCTKRDVCPEVDRFIGSEWTGTKNGITRTIIFVSETECIDRLYVPLTTNFVDIPMNYEKIGNKIRIFRSMLTLASCELFGDELVLNFGTSDNRTWYMYKEYSY